MAKILLVEDDVTFAETLSGFLKKHRHFPEKAFSFEEAKKMIHSNVYDLLLLDYRLSDGTGLDVLEYARAKNMTTVAIFMTRYKDVAIAVKAMKMGAFNFITKPVNPDEFLIIVNEALREGKTSSTNSTTKYTEKRNEYIIGNGGHAANQEEYINVVAPTNMSVIIQGESGTGKEYVARAIHSRSNRKNNPFVAVDCGILSTDLAPSELFGHTKGAFTGAHADKKGVFELANHGTLFLDEVGNLNGDVQAKLLRAVQERVVSRLGANTPIAIDVRILCATNDDLPQKVMSGEFREDLYHRLNEFKIVCEPLRKRKEDLPKFIKHFIEEANRDFSKSVKGIAPDLEQVLSEYHWPGNLRELRNVIRRSVLLSKDNIAHKDTLPAEMIIALYKPSNQKIDENDLHAVKERNERELITQALAKVKNNKSKAAKLLNIDRKTLYKKIEQYGIEV